MAFTEVIIMVGQFMLSLSMLIILHEWGHYYPAKLFKTRVEKFYLFFDAWGKKIFSFTRNGTEYGMGWLPLGGYVKISGMIDESMDTEQMNEEPQPWEFRSKKPWQRLIIMLGGVTVNFVLAYVILVGTSFTYGDKFLPMSELKDGIVASEFVQKEIGLQTGDKVVTIDGNVIENIDDLNKTILFGNEITVNRAGETVSLTIPEDILGRIVDSNTKSIAGIPMPIVVADIPATSLNKKSGLVKGDIIRSIEGIKVGRHNLKEELKKSANKTVALSVMNSDKENRIVNVSVNKDGEIGFVTTTLSLKDMDRLGIYNFSIKTYSFGESFGVAGSKFVGRFDDMLTNVKKLLNSYKTGAAKGMGSFISIAKIFPTRWDWQIFWDRTIMLSIMLGVLNLLPIPALDGGHALFVVYEMITGKKPSDKFLEYAQTVGFFLLMALFVYAFGNDIYRHFIK